MKKIAIIGGGLSAISVLSQLSYHKKDCEIYLFEPLEIGYSSSMATYSPNLLCNTSVGINSLIKDEPLDFYNYLCSRGWNYSIEDFAPRYLLIEYSRYCFKRAIEKSSLKFVHVKEEVISIKLVKDKKIIFCKEKKFEFFDKVFICAGCCNVLPDILNNKNIISYKDKNLYNYLINSKKVAVLGSKLSAIDIAILSCSRGNLTTLYSKSGELPSVRTEILYNNYDFKFQSMRLREFIKSLNSLFADRKNNRNHFSWIQNLQEDYNLALSNNNIWQYYIAKIIDISNELLSKSPAHIPKLRKSLKRFISRFISSIPKENANKLITYYQKGLLDVKKSSVNDFIIEDRVIIHKETGEVYDLLVIATGFENLNISKIKEGDYTINDNSNVISSEDMDFLELNDIYLLGSSCYIKYPIVNYIKFFVDRANDFIVGE